MSNKYKGLKKGAYNKIISRNTRKNEQEYKDKRKEAHIIFRQKVYCLSQRWGKWKLFIITINHRIFIK
jgi:hypothetical protein